MRFRPARALIAAIALTCALAAPGQADPRLELLGSHGWEDGPGGLSGLVMAPDGRKAILVNDRASLFHVTIERDANGSYLGAQVTEERALLPPLENEPPSEYLDTEGLAALPDGSILISLERPGRIWRLPPEALRPEILPRADAFDRFRTNRALESVATDAQGRVFTFGERPASDERGHALYRWDGAEWAVVSRLRADPPFAITGADFGPDGLLYIVERAAYGLRFRTRISRFDPGIAQPRPERLYTSRLGRFDNLEAISLWRGPDGATRVTLLSDNNFLPIQRTEWVEFRLLE